MFQAPIGLVVVILVFLVQIQKKSEKQEKLEHALFMLICSLLNTVVSPFSRSMYVRPPKDSLPLPKRQGFSV